MAKVETASLERETSASRAGFRGLQFIVGQFFAILASVVGIYFASYVSFQRTLEYDRFTRAQQKSSLLAAAREELKQNVARLYKFNQRANEGNAVNASERPQLRLSLWQAASHSPSFFDIRPQVLIEMQAFYGDVDQMLNDSRMQGWLSPDYLKPISERLGAQLTLAETSIVPEMDKEIAEAERITKKYSAAD
jgi:hypothetical protein